MDRDPGHTHEEAAHALELLEFGDAFFELDAQWRIVRVNRRQEELSRKPRSETVGRTLAEVWPELAGPESRYRREYDRCMRERVPVQFQAYYAPLDLWTGVTAYPVSAGGIAVFFRDITRIKRAEQEQTRLAAIVESTDDAIVAKDLDGVILTWNRAAERLFGYAADEVVGRSVTLLIPPDRRHEEAEILAELRAGRRVEHFETQRVRKDGTRLDVSVTVSPVRDEEGRLVGASKIVRDISEQKRSEAVLAAALGRAQEERRRLAAVLEALPAGVVITDAEGGFTEVNAEFKRIWGTPPNPQRMSEYAAWRGWWPDGRPVETREWALSRALSTGDVIVPGDIVDIEKFDGSGRATIINAAAPIRNAEGTIVGAVLAEVDVTEQRRVEDALRRAEEAARASEARFRSVFEQAAVGMGRVRFDDGRWIDVNDAFCRMLGRSREDMLSTPWPAMTHPEDLELDLGPFRRMSAGELDSYTIEKRFLHADGHEVWAKLTLSLVRDARGRPDYEIAIIEDIGDRKRAETALREHEERLRAVMEHMAEGLVIFDPSGNITYQNPASVSIHDRRLAGERRRLDQLVLNWRVRRYPEGIEVPPRDWAIPRVLRGERVQNERFFVDCVEDPGRSFVGIYSGSPVHDAGGKLAYGFLTIEEITEQARAESALRDANEKLREVDRRKDEFLGMLSHELRNPLAPIRNSLYILDHAEPAGQQARRAKDIVARQVEHLTRLVDDLLDVTRIARGKIELRREDLDVVGLARRVAEDHRSLMQGRGVELTIDLLPGALTVNGDPARLTQVLGNLLNNAAKFTPPGGRVTLSVRAEGDRAALRVRDTGPGIAPDVLPTIFEPFFQAKQTLARSEGGLGLGLALVKGLVALHGGEVHAYSAGQGQGTEFVVTVPLAGRGLPAPGEERAAAGAAAAQVHRVLVIDDNRDAADTVAELLAMLGHQVEVAYDAFDALAKVRERVPDVVLCDIGLPGMDGYEFARQFRALTAGRHVRLVALSGYAQPEDIARATEAGFDAHIAKPPDPAHLERLVS
ncbi:hybrid sensor histidine kinase/response regulator [Anaeromyxobacter dehalogenans]|nr:PAS domain S-box protein [Anaeromyxobacter dehalogenans]